jgi:hypothetical protein
MKIFMFMLIGTMTTDVKLFRSTCGDLVKKAAAQATGENINRGYNDHFSANLTVLSTQTDESVK